MYPHYVPPNGARGMITFGPFGLHMHELDTTGHMPPPPLAAAASMHRCERWCSRSSARDTSSFAPHTSQARSICEPERRRARLVSVGEPASLEVSYRLCARNLNLKKPSQRLPPLSTLAHGPLVNDW